MKKYKFYILALFFLLVVYSTIFVKKVASEPKIEASEPIKVVVIHEINAKSEIQRVFGENWRIAYAVAMAESGLKEKAINHNSDRVKSHDRGIFQINSYWHKEVSDECAFDIQCNIKEAYRISDGGKNWKQWTTFIHKKHLRYLPDVI